MKVKIKIGAFASGNNPELTKFLKANEGKFVKVETEHLFNNQYNTAKFRLFDSHISEIKDDARIGKGVCKFCGYAATYPNPCNVYTKSKPSKFSGKSMGYCKEHGTKWFSENNTYFLKYPKGFNEFKELPEQMIGSYRFSSSHGFYWLQNSRKSYKFRYDKAHKNSFIVFDSMGAKNYYSLDIPEITLIKLVNILNK